MYSLFKPLRSHVRAIRPCGAPVLKTCELPVDVMHFLSTVHGSADLAILRQACTKLAAERPRHVQNPRMPSPSRLVPEHRAAPSPRHAGGAILIIQNGSHGARRLPDFFVRAGQQIARQRLGRMQSGTGRGKIKTPGFFCAIDLNQAGGSRESISEITLPR